MNFRGQADAHNAKPLEEPLLLTRAAASPRASDTCVTAACRCGTLDGHDMTQRPAPSSSSPSPARWTDGVTRHLYGGPRTATAPTHPVPHMDAVCGGLNPAGCLAAEGTTVGEAQRAAQRALGEEARRRPSDSMLEGQSECSRPSTQIGRVTARSVDSPSTRGSSSGAGRLRGWISGLGRPAGSGGAGRGVPRSAPSSPRNHRGTEKAGESNLTAADRTALRAAAQSATAASGDGCVGAVAASLAAVVPTGTSFADQVTRFETRLLGGVQGGRERSAALVRLERTHAQMCAGLQLTRERLAACRTALAQAGVGADAASLDPTLSDPTAAPPLASRNRSARRPSDPSRSQPINADPITPMQAIAGYGDLGAPREHARDLARDLDALEARERALVRQCECTRDQHAKLRSELGALKDRRARGQQLRQVSCFD